MFHHIHAGIYLHVVFPEMLHRDTHCILRILRCYPLVFNRISYRVFHFILIITKHHHLREILPITIYYVTRHGFIAHVILIYEINMHLSFLCASWRMQVILHAVLGAKFVGFVVLRANLF